ncbi:methionyl-tRNA formyltransferase [Eubacterium ruminantium]|uniref:Methionyl-tRNA formyltransferase n=1 Tax=Eubacterium ruminantium TaxID=42322 RepID=A0A1T4MLW3_9FIRM|nr:methionyl-tRNA formyltransferase [Eubacterium ruminantium]SDM58839.1 methionyl-tRNA formyltransferase [Eubacterium ruminantium]SJZ68059.1 methionyl-tRNA formyltransferase [Eubacterium ruminantium]
MDNKDIKVVYMGTPEFAVNALRRIHEEGYDIIGCFTQPDKQKGRSSKLIAPPVKVCAEEFGILVFQPEKIREEEYVEKLRSLNPDVIVVAAFGQILPESILNIPKYGCINIHASLLPKYRGAAPIEWAVIDGEKETGVTTMYMEKGLDTGDMIEKAVTEIGADETAEELRSRLADMGAELIISTLKNVISGNCSREKQDDSKSNYAVMLKKEMGKVDWNDPADKIERLIRGLQPWPVVYATLNDKNLKIYAASVEGDRDGEPGEIVEVTKKNFVVKCGSGSLRIKSVQPEGKKRMDSVAFLNGNKIEPGMKLV